MKVPVKGMKGFKIRIDLEMPMPDGHGEEAEGEECSSCGEVHGEDECKYNQNNMRTGPIPELKEGKPVYDSDYIKRVQTAQADKAREKLEKESKK